MHKMPAMVAQVDCWVHFHLCRLSFFPSNMQGHGANAQCHHTSWLLCFSRVTTHFLEALRHHFSKVHECHLMLCAKDANAKLIVVFFIVTFFFWSNMQSHSTCQCPVLPHKLIVVFFQEAYFPEALRHQFPELLLLLWNAPWQPLAMMLHHVICTQCCFSTLVDYFLCCAASVNFFMTSGCHPSLWPFFFVWLIAWLFFSATTCWSCFYCFGMPFGGHWWWCCTIWYIHIAILPHLLIVFFVLPHLLIVLFFHDFQMPPFIVAIFVWPYQLIFLPPQKPKQPHCMPCNNMWHEV